MGQCQTPTATATNDLKINESVISLKVAPQIGMTQEAAWEVRVEEGDTVAILKQRICELYDTPPDHQVIKRAVDGQPLSNEEKLKLAIDKTLHLSLLNPLEALMHTMTAGVPGVQNSGGNENANPLESLMGAMIGHTTMDGNATGEENPFAAIMQAMTNAQGARQNQHGLESTPPTGLADMMAGAMANINAMQQNLDNTTLTLKFVMAGQKPSDPEKRCSVEVAASASLSNVLEMVKMELNVEDQSLALEFCGELLPAVAPVHLVGLSDGDTIKVVPVASS